MIHNKSKNNHVHEHINTLNEYLKEIDSAEAISVRRNREFLADIENVKNLGNALTEKADRLKRIRGDYKNHIAKAYPKWHQNLKGEDAPALPFKNDETITSRYLTSKPPVNTYPNRSSPVNTHPSYRSPNKSNPQNDVQSLYPEFVKKKIRDWKHDTSLTSSDELSNHDTGLHCDRLALLEESYNRNQLHFQEMMNSIPTRDDIESMIQKREDGMQQMHAGSFNQSMKSGSVNNLINHPIENQNFVSSHEHKSGYFLPVVNELSPRVLSSNNNNSGNEPIKILPQLLGLNQQGQLVLLPMTVPIHSTLTSYNSPIPYENVFETTQLSPLQGNTLDTDDVCNSHKQGKNISRSESPTKTNSKTFQDISKKHGNISDSGHGEKVRKDSFKSPRNDSSLRKRKDEDLTTSIKNKPDRRQQTNVLKHGDNNFLNDEKNVMKPDMPLLPNKNDPDSPLLPESEDIEDGLASLSLSDLTDGLSDQFIADKEKHENDDILTQATKEVISKPYKKELLSNHGQLGEYTGNKKKQVKSQNKHELTDDEHEDERHVKTYESSHTKESYKSTKDLDKKDNQRDHHVEDEDEDINADGLLIEKHDKKEVEKMDTEEKVLSSKPSGESRGITENPQQFNESIVSFSDDFSDFDLPSNNDDDSVEDESVKQLSSQHDVTNDEEENLLYNVVKEMNNGFEEPVLFSLLETVLERVQDDQSEEVLVLNLETDVKLTDTIIGICENEGDLSRFNASEICMAFRFHLKQTMKKRKHIPFINENLNIDTDFEGDLRDCVQPVYLELWDALFAFLSSIMDLFEFDPTQVALIYSNALIPQNKQLEVKLLSTLTNILSATVSDVDEDEELDKDEEITDYEKVYDNKKPLTKTSDVSMTEDFSKHVIDDVNFHTDEKMDSLSAMSDSAAKRNSLSIDLGTMSHSDDESSSVSFDSDGLPVMRSKKSRAQHTKESRDNDGFEDTAPVEKKLSVSSSSYLKMREESLMSPVQDDIDDDIDELLGKSLGYSFNTQSRTSTQKDHVIKLSEKKNQNVVAKLSPDKSVSYNIDTESQKRADEKKHAAESTKIESQLKIKLKKPGFWNNSDSDSDVDLEQINKAVSNNNDDDDFDFDFYD